MKPTVFEKTALGLSGLTALVIGAFILSAPSAFYAGYGITLDGDASLLSELRAPGAGLAGMGALMLLGLVRQTILPVSVAVALTVFVAFPAGRIVGLAVDGMPSTGIIGALAVELVVAVLCLAAFRRRLWRQMSALPAALPAR